MTVTDTEFFRAFAGRVRSNLTTTAPEGSPTMNDTTTVETEAPASVPATFQAAPDAPCEDHTWCVETGAHVDHHGRTVSLATGVGGLPILTAYFYSDQPTGTPELDVDLGGDNWYEYATGDQLREQTAKVRAHLARLDALADEHDAIREAGGEGLAMARTVAPAELDDDGRLLDAPRITAEEDGTGYLLSAYICNVGEDGPVLAVEGAVTADLHLPDARRLRASVAAFLPQLDSMIGDLAAAEPQPLPAARTWTVTADNGVKVSGHLPAWSEVDPSRTDIPANRLQTVLHDVTLCRSYPGQLMTVDAPFGADAGHVVCEGQVFRAQLWCAPHDDDVQDREPHGVITVLDDCVMDNLGPDDLADVAAKLRAQADRIDFEMRPALIAARADWAANGGNR